MKDDWFEGGIVSICLFYLFLNFGGTLTVIVQWMSRLPVYRSSSPTRINLALTTAYRCSLDAWNSTRRFFGGSGFPSAFSAIAPKDESVNLEIIRR